MIGLLGHGCPRCSTIQGFRGFDLASAACVARHRPRVDREIVHETSANRDRRRGNVVDHLLTIAKMGLEKKSMGILYMQEY